MTIASPNSFMKAFFKCFYKHWMNLKWKCNHVLGFAQPTIGVPEKNDRINIILSNRDSEKGVQSMEDLKKRWCSMKAWQYLPQPSPTKVFRV